MKGVTGVTAVGRRVSQRSDNLMKFGDGTGPAVNQEQGRGVRIAPVQIVELEPLGSVEAGCRYGGHLRRIVAEQFTHWPGLRSKVWLADPATNTYGGVYVFDSEESAERSRSTEQFREMLESPVFESISIAEYPTLEAPTAITSPALAAG